MENVNVPDVDAWDWIASQKRTKDSPPRIIYNDPAYRCSVAGEKEIIVERKSTDVFGVESWVIVERECYGNSHMGQVMLRMKDKAKGVGNEPLQIEKET